MTLQTVGQYRALIDHSTDIIALFDEAGVIQFASPSVEQTLGYDPDELIGEHAFELIHPDDREQIMESFDRIVETPGQSTERREHRFRHADGSWIWAESVTTNRIDSALEGYVINSRDITGRKEQERNLIEEHEKYTALVEQSHDGVVILQDEAFVFANPRALEITGYDEDELIGMPFAEIIPPEDRDRIKERYEQRIDPESEPPPAQYDTRLLTKNGEKRVVEVSANAIQYEGEPADLATIRDVTERRRYEEQLEATTEELEALNRIVRHDIRNDMSIVLGWAQILEEHVDETGTDYLQKILASGEHIVELTEIARDYVETLTTEEEVTMKPTPLRSILETEFDLRRESYPNAEFVIDGEIPDVTVRANEMLASVFRNLLNNAVQHNDKETPIVEISCEERNEDVIVRVADNGPGIPDDQKESIFGKGDTGIESPSTGIGLYLVQTLVEQYGGDIQVEDNAPEGVVFTVTLPKVE
jgi:PAS domain S-box-containing protein